VAVSIHRNIRNLVTFLKYNIVPCIIPTTESRLGIWL